MARLTHRNGSVVDVADDRVDQLIRSGFTVADPEPPTKKATKRTASKRTAAGKG